MQIESNDNTIITTTSIHTDTLVLEQEQQLRPYSMFKYSIRSESTRKYYERRLRKFFDFVQFEVEVKEIEKRFNDLAERAKNNDTSWILNHIIHFLQFQKERVNTNEITAATLSNFVKSLKIFCV